MSAVETGGVFVACIRVPKAQSEVGALCELKRLTVEELAERIQRDVASAKRTLAFGCTSRKATVCAPVCAPCKELG